MLGSTNCNVQVSPPSTELKIGAQFPVMAGLTAEVPAGLSKVNAVPMIWLGFAGFIERFGSQSWFCSSLQLLGIMLTMLSIAFAPCRWRREGARCVRLGRATGCRRFRQ